MVEGVVSLVIGPNGGVVCFAGTEKRPLQQNEDPLEEGYLYG